MKKLIEASIKLNGIGPSGTKTIFDMIIPNVLPENPTPEEETLYLKNKFNNDDIMAGGYYKALTSIKNRKIVITFDYEENDAITNSKILYAIADLKTDEEIKNDIIVEINKSLK